MAIKSALSSKSILITGASRRLGLSSCESFLQKGCKVVAVSRQANAELENLKLQFQDSFTLIECTEYNQVGAERVISALGANCADVLINNASYFVPDGKNINEKVAQYQAFFETHMLFPLLLSEWFASVTSEDDDTDRVIINMSDIYAIKPTHERAMYCSTKAGLDSLTQSLAAKFAPHVRVNSIQPGPLAFLPEHSESEKSKVMQQTPLGREGGFEVIVNTFEYVIGNPFLTGTAIKVDGGRSLVR